MSLNNIVPFHIESVDSLGQGVSKITDKITFIPKTLPGEKGAARVLAEKSKIAFAQCEELTTTSPRRVASPCPHFSSCPGCHYLHTDYQYELELKLKSMNSLFRNFPDAVPQVISSTQRLHYRNRIQLHYDVKKQKIGFRDAKNNRIVEVPECLIARAEITQVLKDFYQNQHWLKLVPKNSTTGHVEIYYHQQQMKISWNQPYAEGGFSQVHEEMNAKLKAEIEKITQAKNYDLVIDLFAGDGNLSNKLAFKKRIAVDIYPKSLPGPDFFSHNLYAAETIKKLNAQLKNQEADLLILDPPRSGLKNLDEWLEMTKANEVIYVSCDPHTQVRDISALKNYIVKELYLLDLFPSTFHFETMAVLERKK